jgi:DNA-binding response OmpR family regulator
VIGSAVPRFGKDRGRGAPRLAGAREADGVEVLIVEDDDTIAGPLQRGLEREGFRARRVASGAEALAAAPADVVLLDLGLPDLDGFEVCRRLRAASDVPIIVLTARGDEIDRVVGLELGADDYVTKPFGFRELVARIRAVTRRSRKAPSPTGTPDGLAGGPDGPAGVTAVGPLRVDRPRRRVALGDAEVHLTPKEFDLLALLAAEPEVVRTREEILEQVWDPHWYGPTKTLDVHVASLRRKLGDPRWIETVRGVGFRLVEPR